MQAQAADAGEVEQLLSDPYLFFGLNITLQVMAVTDVSARHESTIAAFSKRPGDEDRIHPARAHHADGADVGGILHAGHPGQVGPGVGAPVT
jgi:hypothetical protein